jgi:hypothetical protein
MKDSFRNVLAQLDVVLSGSARHDILDALVNGDGDALARLRHAMRTHTFVTSAGPLSLRSMVDRLDARTQGEGLHVLQGWDFVAHRFPDEIAPVLLLDFCARSGVAGLAERPALSLLLDQYFLALLALAAVRAWDDGDANENLDRVTALLAALQGKHGSGRRFVDDAETLLLLAVSYYHPEEPAYDVVLARVRTLDAEHRLRFALPCASVMASHLRWGFRFMYGRDVGAMRADNVVDYPWLLFALLTLSREYAVSAPGSTSRNQIVEALMDGLSADPWAFTGKLPAFLAQVKGEHEELRELLVARKDELLADLERQQPTASAYSPLAFSCNFLSNAAVAMVMVELENPGATDGSLSALLSRDSGEPAEGLARGLMAYSSRPERLGAGGAPLIVFDPRDGIGAYNALVRTVQSS